VTPAAIPSASTTPWPRCSAASRAIRNSASTGGLPVTVIVSTTLEQLQAAAGFAVTAGGTLMPMADLIRMASHAYHYLCVFDSHSEQVLYLGRAKRIATADQRVVLHAKDHGCSAPGCDVPT